MTAFMGRLTPEYVQSISGKDDVLQKLLLEIFESDWTKAKECLLFDRWPLGKTVKAPHHSASLSLMGELVKLRTRVCNAVASTTQRTILQQLQQEPLTASNPLHLAGLDAAFRLEVSGGSAELHFSPLTSTGAEKLTSDIDVASGGLNTEIAVRLFNTNFRQALRVNWDPATVFDYNVYAADWIFPQNFVDVVVGNTTERTPRPEDILATDSGESPQTDARLQRERARLLVTASLLHLRRSCTPSEWASYLQQRASEGALIVTQLQVVNNQFAAFSAEIAAAVTPLRASVPRSPSLWPDSYVEEALETRARNQIYQNRLLRVKALRLSYKLLKETATKTDADRQQMYTLAMQITEALTDSIYFANEVYATEGATLHATQAIQKVAKARSEGRILVVHLTDTQYLQSFHENVGDALHSLSHYESDPSYAAYRAGKYIERMLLAGEILAKGAPVLRGHQSYAFLKALAEKAAVVKASEDGDDPVKIAPFFQDYKSAADLVLLRKAVLKLGAELAGKIPE